MSELRLSSLKGRKGESAPLLPDGAVVTGVTTSTSFDGNITGNVTGNITGTTGSFSGHVSVGGAISYEDVSAVDSVGVITARSGIKVGAGQSISPVSGIVTYYGDGSQLTGVESGAFNFVASGTIANGNTVVINTDGTVSVVGETVPADPSAGTPVVYESANSFNTAATYDSSNNKVVIAYRDVGNSNYGTAIVGTVSGTSISFGTPVVFESASTDAISATFDSSNNKVVIAYIDEGNNNYGKAVVGTVSGTSISFGSIATFESAAMSDLALAYDSSNQRVVIIWRKNDGSDYYGWSIVGTVSGTSISFGTKVAFYNSGTVFDYNIAYDSGNQKVVITYQAGGNSNYGTAIVGTVSGTSISYGTSVVFESASSSYNNIVYDSSNQKVVIAYMDVGNSEYGTAVVGTVSGTSISFGTPVVFESASVNASQSTQITYDSSNGKVVIAYRDGGNSNYGTAIVGTVSGTSISFGTPLVFESSNTDFYAITYDSSNEKVVIAYRDIGNSSYGTAVVFSSISFNLTDQNYIGIAAEAIANGQTGKITVVAGINEGQTGLTTGKTYYVQSSGGISTVASSPSVVAGTAISSTKIVVK